MITVCLNQANFEYDIHSLIKAFYAKEEVKVFSDREKIRKLEEVDTPLFHIEISYYPAVLKEHKDKIEIILFLPPKKVLGIPYEEGGYSIGAQAETETDFSDRRETKNHLKHCLYQMLSKYTGQKLPWGSLTGIRPTKIPMSMLEAGKEDAEIRSYMRDTYFASKQKINLSIEIAKREMKLLEQIDYKDGYSLYVGIPFCPSICSYCSFSSSPIGKWHKKVDAYLDALEQEIDFVANKYASKKLNTIYIGGGTPTTLLPEQMNRLLTKIENSFDFTYLLEYMVEAGRPDSITREKLKVMRDHEISRISINPQTMKQKTLDIIGRGHTIQQTLDSFLLAREMGFDNINMDLIVGLPEEQLEDVRDTLEQIKELSPDNLTVHSLAIKRAAKLRMFPEDYKEMEIFNSWEMIDMTAEYARKMGLLPYYLYRQKNMAGNFENVGYAKIGKAGIYNILIMEEVQTIVALGAGSISKRVYPDGRIERCENVKDVALYIENINEMIKRKQKLFM